MIGFFNAFKLVVVLVLSVLSGFVLLLYGLQIIAWLRVWRMPSTAHAPLVCEDTNTFSLIIAFRNESINIEQLLRSLAGQKTKFSEIILVDDHSTDNGVDLIHTHLKTSTLQAQVMPNNGQGKKAALQTGAMCASSTYLVFTDADCTHPPLWLTSIKNHVNATASDLCIGPVLFHGDASFLAQFQQLDFAALQVTGGAAAMAKRPIMMNGANMVCKRDVFLSANLKPKFASGDDMFLLEDVLTNEGVVTYIKDKNAIISTVVEPTLTKFLHQRARWASKAKGYSNGAILRVGALIVAVNGLMLLGLLLSPFHLSNLLVFGTFFLFKTILDYTLLKSAQYFFAYKLSLGAFLLAQLIYPIYILTVLAYPWFYKVRWKERSV